jgi:hypothetical protein
MNLLGSRGGGVRPPSIEATPAQPTKPHICVSYSNKPPPISAARWPKEASAGPGRTGRERERERLVLAHYFIGITFLPSFLAQMCAQYRGNRRQLVIHKGKLTEVPRLDIRPRVGDGDERKDGVEMSLNARALNSPPALDFRPTRASFRFFRDTLGFGVHEASLLFSAREGIG